MRRRKAISSIYGFIMIFLLSMASLQTWSSAVSSMASIESASDQGSQLQQMQSIEHLTLAESGANLTISNNGEVPSTVEFLRLAGPNDSRTIPLGTEIAVGSSVTMSVPPGETIEAVTALGNVFTMWPSDPPGAVWSGEVLQDGLDNAQLFQSPYYNSSFFLADGPSVYAFSDSGFPRWSFDAGSGFITDVLPLSNGDVYVSAGYGSTSNVADLFELSASGAVIQTYSVRLFQTPDGPSGDSSLPVTKGEDASYALYDGWFYSDSGAFAGLVSDSFPLVGSDASNFYFYSISPVQDDNDVCQLPGNEFVVDSYAPSSSYGDARLNWQDYMRLSNCNPYPEQLVGSAMEGGVLAVLLASPPYAVTPVEGYPAQNPYLALVSSSGLTLHLGQTPENGYSSVATNGTDVYLALPQPGEVEVYSLPKNTYTTYNIGIQASQLLFEDGSLFAISSDAVKVFGPSMNLEKTIDLAPLSLASSSDSFVQEPSLQAPSFLVLNATSYAALLISATGFTSLIMGRYS
jgi:hypothetical protein